MKIRKKALLYDIANMAYMIADTGEPLNHSLHKVRDICEEGNIDRVSRILGIAYAEILNVLSPVMSPSGLNPCRDNSSVPHDYSIEFSDNEFLRFRLTTERKLKIRERAHEYMVGMALADWLGMTLPPAADVWKERAEEAICSLKELVASVMAGSAAGFRRRISVI